VTDVMLSPASSTQIWRYLRRSHRKQKEGTLHNRCRHRPVQYLNNIIEQDHRAIKRRVKAKQNFREFHAARRTIEGYEAMHMIRKGQARWVTGNDVCRQNQFIDKLFDLAA
jgi:transposase-like protein